MQAQTSYSSTLFVVLFILVSFIIIGNIAACVALYIWCKKKREKRRDKNYKYESTQNNAENLEKSPDNDMADP